MTYTIVNDTLPTGADAYDNNSGTSINASGEMVGSVLLPPKGYSEAAEWSTAGAMAVLNDLPEYNSVNANGINDSGEIVGSGQNNVDGGANALVWAPGGGSFAVLQDIGGDDESDAYAINDAGFSVGGSHSTTLWNEAVEWNPSGSAQILTSLGTSNTDGEQQSSAQYINDLGEAAGRSNDEAVEWSSNGSVLWNGPDGSQVTGLNASGAAAVDVAPVTPSQYATAIYVSPTGNEVALENPGVANVSVGAINNSGHIVGASQLVRGDGAATEWTKAGVATILGTLPGEFEDYAVGINNKGDVIGESALKHGRVISEVATFWNAAGKATNLKTILGTGWTGTTAETINDAGDIAGYGKFDGTQIGFELLYVPAAGAPDGGTFVNVTPHHSLAPSLASHT